VKVLYIYAEAAKHETSEIAFTGFQASSS